MFSSHSMIIYLFTHKKVKVENAAERLKEGNLFLEASISAYDFTFARVRKRVAAAMCGVHSYLAQGVSESGSSEYVSVKLLSENQ